MATYRVTVGRAGGQAEGYIGSWYLEEKLEVKADSRREAEKKAEDWVKSNSDGRCRVYANGTTKLSDY